LKEFLFILLERQAHMYISIRLNLLMLYCSSYFIAVVDIVIAGVTIAAVVVSVVFFMSDCSRKWHLTV